MDVVYDMKMECLCCGKLGYVSSEHWRSIEAPAALCLSCAQTTPRSMVRVLYLMRSQIRMLHEEQQHMKRDIKNLYTAQQDLEQMSLGGS
jgi:hypothetical protein